MLSKLTRPASCLLSIYILSGSDYVSSFFGLSHHAILRAFLNNYEVICSDEELALFVQSDGEMPQFKGLSIPACVKFILSAYYDRHKRFFGSQGIGQIAAQLRDRPVPEDLRRQLCWLGYPDSPFIEVRSIADWIELVQRLTFQDSSAGANHEAYMLPSQNALHLHVLRAGYAVRLVFDSVNENSSISDFEGCGWGKTKEGKVYVVWDGNPSSSKPIVFPGEYRCGCRTGCKGDRDGCRHCFQECRPCTTKCYCRGRCENPHNTGATCTRCKSTETANNVLFDVIFFHPSMHETGQTVAGCLLQQHYEQQHDEQLQHSGVDDREQYEMEELGISVTDSSSDTEYDATLLPEAFPSYEHIRTSEPEEGPIILFPVQNGSTEDEGEGTSDSEEQQDDRL